MAILLTTVKALTLAHPTGLLLQVRCIGGVSSSTGKELVCLPFSLWWGLDSHFFLFMYKIDCSKGVQCDYRVSL